MSSDSIEIMKQIDYKPKYPPHSSETMDSSDSYWKHPQARSQSFPTGRSNRSPETVTSYYSSSTSYKPSKSYAYPTYAKPKYLSSHCDETYCTVRNHSKLEKDKHYPLNCSMTRKNRYDEDLGDNEKLKYIKEELDNFTEDNCEADADEEETEDDHDTGEFLSKDYEDQITDDEREEECNASPQAQRTQKASKKEVLLRQQRWRAIEQQNLRRLHCQQHVALGQGRSSPSRYCHNVASHDDAEPLSEEDFVPTSLKNPTKTPTTDYHQWQQFKNESDRYNQASLPTQTSRRARTKPEAEPLMDSEVRKTRKCYRCGSISNKKSETPTKNSGCRFDDRGNIPTKGPIGDEPTNYDQTYYGRCVLRHSAKDTNEIPTSLHATKSRRSRDAKSPTIYDVPDQDKVDHYDYSRSPTRHQRRATDLLPEKIKRSVHTSYGPSRMPFRYEE